MRAACQAPIRPSQADGPQASPPAVNFALRAAFDASGRSPLRLT